MSSTRVRTWVRKPTFKKTMKPKIAQGGVVKPVARQFGKFGTQPQRGK